MDIPQFISTLVGGHLGATTNILVCVLWQTHVHISVGYTYRVGPLGHRVCTCSVSVYTAKSFQKWLYQTPLPPGVYLSSSCFLLPLKHILNAIIVHEEIQGMHKGQKEKV